MLRRVGNTWTPFPGPVMDDRLFFEMAYAASTQKLYVVHVDTDDNNWYVDVWEPHDDSPWSLIARTSVPSGGNVTDPQVGGTGIEVNRATGNVFNVNTASNNVSVLSGQPNYQVDATVGLGLDPFPIAINSQQNRVFIGLRDGRALIKLVDNY